jgi:hypothetical protein
VCVRAVGCCCRAVVRDVAPTHGIVVPGPTDGKIVNDAAGAYNFPGVCESVCVICRTH